MITTIRGVITATATMAALGGCLFVAPAAHAASPTGSTSTTEPAPPVLESGNPVKNFIHPGSAHLAETRGVVLKDGDGHILFADCTPDREQIQVASAGRGGRPLCFTLTGSTGWLSLEIPDTYGIRSGINHDLTVTTNDNGHTETRTVAKGTRSALMNDNYDDVTVVELRIG
jgi:hypothetical protein